MISSTIKSTPQSLSHISFVACIAIFLKSLWRVVVISILSHPVERFALSRSWNSSDRSRIVSNEYHFRSRSICIRGSEISIIVSRPSFMNSSCLIERSSLIV